MLLSSNPVIRGLSRGNQSYGLESIYRLLNHCEGVSVSIEGNYFNSSFHDAGYDSYITGFCFAKMLHYFSICDLETYCNKLYSHKSLFTINLRGEDELPSDVIFVYIIESCLYS